MCREGNCVASRAVAAGQCGCCVAAMWLPFDKVSGYAFPYAGRGAWDASPWFV